MCKKAEITSQKGILKRKFEELIPPKYVYFLAESTLKSLFQSRSRHLGQLRSESPFMM